MVTYSRRIFLNFLANLPFLSTFFFWVRLCLALMRCVVNTVSLRQSLDEGSPEQFWDWVGKAVMVPAHFYDFLFGFFSVNSTVDFRFCPGVRVRLRMHLIKTCLTE